MPSRTIQLSDEDDALIESLVQSGEFASADEAISECVRRVARTYEEQVEAFRQAAQVGIDAMERGDYRTFTSRAEFMAYLESSSDEIIEEALKPATINR